jgi:hypothetical protein
MERDKMPPEKTNYATGGPLVKVGDVWHFLGQTYPSYQEARNAKVQYNEGVMNAIGLPTNSSDPADEPSKEKGRQ